MSNAKKSACNLKIIWTVRALFGFRRGSTFIGFTYNILVVVTLIFIFWNFSNLNLRFKTKMVVEYFAFFLQSQFNNDRSTRRYFSQMPVDTWPDAPRLQQRLEKFFTFLVAMVFVFLIVYSYIFVKLWMPDELTGGISSAVIFAAVISAKLIHAAVVSLFSCRIKILWTSLRTNGFQYKTENEHTPSQFLKTYVRIMEDFLQWTNKQSLMLLLDAASATATLLNLFHTMVATAKLGATYDLRNVMILIIIVQFCLFFALPWLLVELALNDIDSMKNYIADQMLTCQSARARTAMRGLCVHMRRERFVGGVWRALPCGLQQPLQVAALALAYLIDYLQLTNFFD